MTEPDDIATSAAVVAADVTEAKDPQDRRRLAAAFTGAAASGARAAGRGVRAARHGAGSGTGWSALTLGVAPECVRIRRWISTFPGSPS